MEAKLLTYSTSVGTVLAIVSLCLPWFVFAGTLELDNNIFPVSGEVSAFGSGQLYTLPCKVIVWSSAQWDSNSSDFRLGYFVAISCVLLIASIFLSFKYLKVSIGLSLFGGILLMGASIAVFFYKPFLIVCVGYFSNYLGVAKLYSNRTSIQVGLGPLLSAVGASILLLGTVITLFRRKKKSVITFLKLSMLLMFIMFISLSKTNETIIESEINTDVVTSGHYTPVQVATFAFKIQSGKMGSTTEYEFIGPSGERNPRFYSGIIAKVEGTKLDLIARLRIEVSGTDPNGNPLSSDRFVNPSVLSSPDQSSVEQEILKVIYNVLVSAMPYGLSEIVKCTQSSGGATYGWTENYAYGEWYYTGTYQEKGLRYGFDLRVYPDVEGTYTIKIHYLTEFSLHSPLGNFPYIKETYDTLTYQYVNKPLTPSQPSGPTAIYLGKSYVYSASTIDPNSDMLRYEFDWNDGTVTYTDWYPSGVNVSASHVWSQAKDKYYVKVRAQDNTGTWSDWSTALTVNRLCNLTISVSGVTESIGVKIWVDGIPYTAYSASPVKVTVTVGQHIIEAENVVTGYSTYLFCYWLDGSTSYTANPWKIQLIGDKFLTASYRDP